MNEAVTNADVHDHTDHYGGSDQELQGTIHDEKYSDVENDDHSMHRDDEDNDSDEDMIVVDQDKDLDHLIHPRNETHTQDTNGTTENDYNLLTDPNNTPYQPNPVTSKTYYLCYTFYTPWNEIGRANVRQAAAYSDRLAIRNAKDMRKKEFRIWRDELLPVAPLLNGKQLVNDDIPYTV
jgi:hypothetical protein